MDVKLYASDEAPINTAHMGIGPDTYGATIWFTGKRTSTIGKIDVNKQVTHFQLDTFAALPISYLPDLMEEYGEQNYLGTVF